MTHALPPLQQLMSELVALPSVSSLDPALDQSNDAVVAQLATWCEALGFAVDIEALPGQTGKRNLIARLGQGTGGLALSGHTDTVPYDPDGWHSDPFTLTERDGRLYGLGISDMKGFLAMAVEAASHYRAADLTEPLWLVATADEESGMDGARALATGAYPRARAVIIGEPTGLHPVHAHKGVLMAAVRVTGRAGHASDPSLGINALDGMRRVMDTIAGWREDLERAHRNPRFRVPVPTVNLGYIHGGDNPNRICAQCELHIDIRTLPGMDADEVLEALREAAQTAIAGRGLELVIDALFEPVPSMETPRDAAIVTAAEALTGHKAEAVAFGTEGPFFNALGMDTIVLGPGDIAQAHQPDEYLALERIEPLQQTLHGLIERFCIHPHGS